jgi:O-methyltransferase domain
MAEREERPASPMALAELMFPSTVRCISIAAQYKLADLLADGPLDVEKLATKSGARARPLRTVMQLLAAAGIFAEVEPGRFTNTALSYFLRSDVPDSLRSMAQMVGEPWLWSCWGELQHTVATGNPAFEKVHGTNAWAWFAQNPEPARRFNQAMTEFSEALSERIVKAYPEFGDARVVADLGGGHGSYLAAILARYPAIGRGMLVELPPVAAQAKGNPRTKTLLDQGRFELHAADFFASVPAGVDIYVTKQIMHSWDDEHLLRLLRLCRQTSPNARVVAAEMVQDEAASHFVASFDLVMMITMRGGIRSAEEFTEVYRQAGYRLNQIISTDTAFSLIEALPTT